MGQEELTTELKNIILSNGADRNCSHRKFSHASSPSAVTPWLSAIGVEAGDTPLTAFSKSVANSDDPRVGGALNSTEYPTRTGAMMNASHQAPLRNLGK